MTTSRLRDLCSLHQTDSPTKTSTRNLNWCWRSSSLCSPSHVALCSATGECSHNALFTALQCNQLSYILDESVFSAVVYTWWDLVPGTSRMSKQAHSAQLNAWYERAGAWRINVCFIMTFKWCNLSKPVPLTFVPQSSRRTIQLPVGVVFLHTHHPGEHPHQQRLEVCVSTVLWTQIKWSHKGRTAFNLISQRRGIIIYHFPPSAHLRAFSFRKPPLCPLGLCVLIDSAAYEALKGPLSWHLDL